TRVATSQVATSSTTALTPALVRRLIGSPARADARGGVRSRGGSWEHPLKRYQRDGPSGGSGQAERRSSALPARDGRTAMPVLRSRTGRGRASVLAGWSRWIAAANRSLAASDRRSDSRRSRPAQAATTIAPAVTTTAGASHNRI